MGSDSDGLDMFRHAKTLRSSCRSTISTCTCCATTRAATCKCSSAAARCASLNYTVLSCFEPTIRASVLSCGHLPLLPPSPLRDALPHSCYATRSASLMYFHKYRHQFLDNDIPRAMRASCASWCG